MCRWNYLPSDEISRLKMGSRSGSRDRQRHRTRSRSPRPRSTSGKDRDLQRNRHHDKPHVKQDDRNRDRDRLKMSGANSENVRVKAESSGDSNRRFGDGQTTSVEEPDAEPEAEKPSFALSGKLMEDTNVFNGVVIKFVKKLKCFVSFSKIMICPLATFFRYSEPDESRKPKKRWRFYVFKGDETLPVMHLHRQSAYLVGKDRKIADIPVDHPSCSRQHAVLQYRCVNNRILPYVIDLGSSNGTYLNNNRIDPQRYVELREKDVLKFGYSSREYVLLHENSQEK